jgi:3',5'-nucleoside bisphosphate phosphatase
MKIASTQREFASSMKTPSRASLNVFAAAITLGVLVGRLDATAQARFRTELQFADVPGYVTLKCDFHMHTVFSDGSVWPTVRVEEAWRYGLDAIAITDHIEYLAHRADVNTNYGRSYELARAAAEPLGIIVIRAAEITRGEPPGHLNALFLKTIDPLRTPRFQDAVKAAVDQGAFVFWNHPGWKQPERKSVWYAEQGELCDKGWLNGIEVVNGEHYDPIAHQWCVDKKLAILANSDVHGPIGWDHDASEEGHRPVTLVFATRRSEEAVKEALLARRTAVFTGKQLLGEEQFLKPLFAGAIEVKGQPVRFKGRNRVAVQAFNRSPISFELQNSGQSDEVTVLRNITLQAGKTSLIELSAKAAGLSGPRTLALPFRVDNLKTAPDKSLTVELKVAAEFAP